MILHAGLLMAKCPTIPESLLHALTTFGIVISFTILVPAGLAYLWAAQVMGGTCGKWVQWFTLVLTVLNLMGNGTAQIVAGAANTYFINPVLTKRCVPLAHDAPSAHKYCSASFSREGFRPINVA